MDTPFKWMKQVPSYFGGASQGMAVPWPGHITDLGGIRRQFHHVIDIVPTILEATGVPAPGAINGIPQAPIEGVSMMYSWDKANAAAPSRHTTQYFEMLGNRAIYQDGWGAATIPVTRPWKLSAAPPPDVLSGYKWELYNVTDDPTQTTDLAATMPDKLKQMQALFYSEAKKYGVLPLDNTTLARWNGAKPNLTAGRTDFSYVGKLSGVPNSGAPSIINKSYTITAELTIPKGGAQGMIVTDGGRFGGYALSLSGSYNYWLRDSVFRAVGLTLLIGGFLVLALSNRLAWSGGKRRIGHVMVTLGALWAAAVILSAVLNLGRGKPVFVYNLLNLKRTIWDGSALGAGKHTVVFDFKSDGPELGKGGTGVLLVDGKEVSRKSVEHTTPVTFPEDETFDIGEDTRSGVAMLRYRYDVPFTFTGKIDKLSFKLAPFKPEPEVPTVPKPELPPMAAPDPVDTPDSK